MMAPKPKIQFTRADNYLEYSDRVNNQRYYVCKANPTSTRHECRHRDENRVPVRCGRHKTIKQ